MLHVFQSDQVEDLVATLAYRLDQKLSDDAVTRAFREERIVVPNRNLGTYLHYQIAARKGVSANLRFETMEDFLASLIPEDEEGRPRAELVSDEAVTRLLLYLLEDEEFCGVKEVAPVRRFLETRHGEMAEERRRFQLATRLAVLFREYGYSRIEMLQAWACEDALATTEEEHHREIEAWQRLFWRALFGSGGMLEETSKERELPLISLTQIQQKFGHHELRWPEALHIFGFSFLPPFFFQLFDPMNGPVTEEELNLYVMTPCLQAWDDIQTSDPEDEPEWAASEESEIFAAEESPLALRIWGRPGRDFHRQILNLTDDITSPAQPARYDYTLLQRMQAVIRERRDVRHYAEEISLKSGLPQEQKSVRFLSCPGAQRECEIIASEIWELVNAHKDLKFNEIAVVVQPRQRGAYQTHLRAAFEQTHQIPHNVIDIDGSRVSSALEAVRLLLDLPLGRFRRRELLALLVHPCVMERFGGGNREQWVRWCDELNIFHGADRSDHAGTYLEDVDRYNWEQGLKRLVLGSFMAQPDKDKPKGFSVGEDPYLPLEVGQDGFEGAATLVMVAQMFLEDARAVRKPEVKRPLREWMGYFQSLVRTYLKAEDDRDGRALMRFQGSLGRIGEADYLLDESVGYRAAYDFAMQALSALEDSYGQYLADGVVVSSFRPMRPIPFKVVFVAGLDEGQFPAPEPPDPLDLRNASRQLSDVRRREQDRYMFLETLMSTRARLYLSWVGRDENTGEHREPASVVRELQEMLQPLESKEALANREFRHPLRRYDELYFDESRERKIDVSGADAIPPVPPGDWRRDGLKPGELTEDLWPNHHREARREAEVQVVSRDLGRTLDAQDLEGYRPSIEELRQAMEAGDFERLAEALHWAHPPLDDGRGRAPDRVVLKIRDLSRFLDCPMQASARVLMRLYEDGEEDVFDADDEPFESEFLPRLSILREIFDQVLEEGEAFGPDANLEKLLDEKIKIGVLSGDLPTGIFLDADREKTLTMLRIWRGNLERFRRENSALVGKVHRVEFSGAGSGVEDRVQRVILELPVRLEDGREFNVELHGVISALGEHMEASVQTSFSSRSSPQLKHFTRGVIEQLVLRAAGFTRGGSTAVVLPLKEGAKFEKFMRSLTSLSQGEAVEYLTKLAGELLGGVHDYFFPVDVVDDALKALNKGEVNIGGLAKEILVKDPKSQYYSAPRSAYGPVKNWQGLRPPGEDEARAIIERRFGPFML